MNDRYVAYGMAALVLVTVGLTLGILFYPSLWASARARELEAARTPEEITAAAQPLLLADDERSREILEGYAAGSPLRVYDRGQNVLAFHDPDAGTVHVLHRNAGTSYRPKEKSRYRELRAVESVPEAFSFVALPEAGGAMVLFLNQGPLGLIEDGVTEEDLARWRKTGVYRHFAGRLGPPPPR